jgi:hypothetical protein
MSRKKSKKAVKKVSSSGVRRVPSAFDDDLFVEADSQKGSCFWLLLRFNIRDNCPPGSKNEFMDIDSFSDAAPKVHKDAVLVIAAEAPAAAETPAAAEAPAAAADVSLPIHSRDEASPEFTKELELTVHRGRILSRVLPCSKFAKLFPKAKLPLLPWLHLIKALVRLIMANY